jgi:long-chain acyl-CoA synthetase
MDSPVGREVIACLRETHRRNDAVSPDMNLELDLGFDSMERVELLSRIEERLNVSLTNEAAAEIFTVRDLVAKLNMETVGAVNLAAASRQGYWKTLLSEDPADGRFHPSGTIVSALKFFLLKILHYGLFKPMLRLKSIGLENLPEKGPYLICPNHQSYIDSLVLIVALPFGVFRRMFFVGYSAIFAGPVMKHVARIVNIIPVDPDTHLLGAMKAGAARLRRGGILCIFPEGGRSFDGELDEFKKGAAILARELSLPMVPAAIAGAYEVWPRGSFRIRLHKVRVAFGEAIMPEENSADDPYREDMERLRQSVSRLFNELREKAS